MDYLRWDGRRWVKLEGGERRKRAGCHCRKTAVRSRSWRRRESAGVPRRLTRKLRVDE